MGNSPNCRINENNKDYEKNIFKCIIRHNSFIIDGTKCN